MAKRIIPVRKHKRGFKRPEGPYPVRKHEREIEDRRPPAILGSSPASTRRMKQTKGEPSGSRILIRTEPSSSKSASRLATTSGFQRDIERVVADITTWEISAQDAYGELDRIEQRIQQAENVNKTRLLRKVEEARAEVRIQTLPWDEFMNEGLFLGIPEEVLEYNWRDYDKAGVVPDWLRESPSEYDRGWDLTYESFIELGRKKGIPREQLEDEWDDFATQPQYVPTWLR